MLNRGGWLTGQRLQPTASRELFPTVHFRASRGQVESWLSRRFGVGWSPTVRLMAGASGPLPFRPALIHIAFGGKSRLFCNLREQRAFFRESDGPD